MTTLLDIENLEVTAGRRRVLSVPRLALDDGRMLALMGPNGAGKSTLLRACLGIQPHVAGRIRVLGAELGRLGWRGRVALRRSIGYVPQILSARTELPLTVREVVAIGVTGPVGLFGRINATHWQRVDRWLARLGLADLSGQSYSRLSGGEQRKVLIARAMVQNPRLLLLDEPTANLDLGWRERIVATVGELHEREGVSVILACHELEVLPPACRQVLLLDRGRVLDEGTPETVFTDVRVAALYGAGLRVCHQDGRHAVLPARCAHA